MNNRTVKIRISALIFALLFAVLTLAVAADYPKPENYVADSASVLAESTVRSIRKSNETLLKDYGAVVAICTVKNTGDTPIAEYARAIFAEWKMTDGVLLLISVEANDYYFIQSAGLEGIITNEQLQIVRNDYLEPDFGTGNIERGVNKTATKLTTLIQSGIQKRAEEEKNAAAENDGGTAAGRVIVTILKVILWVVLIAVALFAVLFVTALFNDDVAELMRKYIFAREKKNTYRVPDTHYDERLYGGREPERVRRERPAELRAPRQTSSRPRDQYPAERRERPRQNYVDTSTRRMYDEYSNQRQNHADVFYNSDGTVRRPRGNAPQSGGYENDATRTFSVQNPGNRRR